MVPFSFPPPLIGSYRVLGINDTFCFTSQDRFGPYQDDFQLNQTGPRPTRFTWQLGNLGTAQERCYQRNFNRFGEHASRTPRTALLFRVWDDFGYLPGARALIRSLVAELSLATGSEFRVYLLVHIKDNSKSFWGSDETYQGLLDTVIPSEFRDMSILWSEAMMESFYPGPFEPQWLQTEGSVYRVHRSMHLPLQWSAVHHPTYDYVINWEADISYTGPWLELFYPVTRWAKEQSRQGIWERNERFYIPAIHGNWSSYCHQTYLSSIHSNGRTNTEELANSTAGVGEEADLIVFNPMFEPEKTEYVWRDDISGYDLSSKPTRRGSVVTGAIYSRQLLLHMHKESAHHRHTMASEMYPASCAYNFKYKAVFAPHPVYLDRHWPADKAEQIFNGGPNGASGGYRNSVFSLGREKPLQSGTYYYAAELAPRLWHEWHDEPNMCLPPILLHPIKFG